MSPLRTIRSLRPTFFAAAAFLVAGCAEPTAPAPAAPRLGVADQPVAHWMKAVSLTGAYDFATAPDGAIWAAAADQGVLRSADGFRWEAAAAIPGGAQPATIAVAADGTIWLGSDQGVLRSHDGGATWISSGLGDQYVSHVAVDDRGRVFALATGGLGGLFRSDDGGLHWSRVFEPISPREAIYEFLTVYRGDVFIGPYSQTPYQGFESGLTWEPLFGMWELPDFAGFAGDMLVTSAGTVLAGYNGGIGRSNDGGRTWKQAYAQYPAFRLVNGGRAGLFALVNEGRVIRSLDDGVTWTAFAAAPPMRGIEAAAVAADGRLVVSGYEGTWKSVP